MSMQVNCPGCAKKLAVSEELLGKKIKCPGCQTVLALAAPKAQRPTTPVRQPSQPPTAAAKPNDSFVVACRCGTKMRVTSAARGKQVRCPGCSNAVKIPAAKPAASAPKPAPSPASAAAPLATSTDPLGATAAAPFPDLGQTGLDTPAAASPSPAPAGGGMDWDSLPSAGSVSPAAANPFPVASAGGRPQTKAQRDDAALAAAGAYQPSLEEKMGGVVAASNQAAPGWGDYFSSRANLTILGLILIGPLFFGYGLYTQQKQAALASEGVKVPGVILAGEEIRGRKGRRSYSFDVAYSTEQGEAILGEFSVTGSFFKAHISGDAIGNDQVEVVYRREDPKEAIIVGGSSGGGANMVIGLLMTAIGVIGFVVTYFFDFEF